MAVMNSVSLRSSEPSCHRFLQGHSCPRHRYFYTINDAKCYVVFIIDIIIGIAVLRYNTSNILLLLLLLILNYFLGN